MDCFTMRMVVLCAVLLLSCTPSCHPYTADQVYTVLSSRLTNVEINVQVNNDKLKDFEETQGNPSTSGHHLELPEISQKIEQNLAKNVQQRTRGLSRAFAKEKRYLQDFIESARLECQADIKNQMKTLEKSLSENVQASVADIKRMLHGAESKTNTNISELHTSLNKQQRDIDKLATQENSVNQTLHTIIELSSRIESRLTAIENKGLDTITELTSRMETRLTSMQNELDQVKKNSRHSHRALTDGCRLKVLAITSTQIEPTTTVPRK